MRSFQVIVRYHAFFSFFLCCLDPIIGCTLADGHNIQIGQAYRGKKRGAETLNPKPVKYLIRISERGRSNTFKVSTAYASGNKSFIRKKGYPRRAFSPLTGPQMCT